ncbi:MAG: hypothetical protein U9M96_03440 [Thermodesulfobacteriota bacterium]|nr:hypothetical protein [Thermodesulfobacteriota bacterium]
MKGKFFTFLSRQSRSGVPLERFVRATCGVGKSESVAKLGVPTAQSTVGTIAYQADMS